jgi:hypothetical protein
VKQVTEIVLYYDRDRWRWQAKDIDGQDVAVGVVMRLAKDASKPAVLEAAIAVSAKFNLTLEPEDFSYLCDGGGVCVWNCGDDECCEGWVAVASDMPVELSNDFRRGPIRVSQHDATDDCKRMSLDTVRFVNSEGDTFYGFQFDESGDDEVMA